jgi:hypothetical protein
MAQEIINIGILPNDGKGEPIRTALIKIGNMFTELYKSDFSTSTEYTTGNVPGQLIFQTPADSFTQAKLQVNSRNPQTDTTQNITIGASINHDTATVGFSAYGTVFTGEALTRYDMDIFEGNVRLLSNPLTTDTLVHFTSCQVTFPGKELPGLEVGVDGYPVGTLMITQDDLILTTES